ETSGGQNKGGSGRDQAGDAGGQTVDELGRASIYEDATEMQRRINRGEEADSAEGQERADDSDTAGGPPRQEMPESRGDQDTDPWTAENNPSRRDAAAASGHTGGGNSDGADGEDGEDDDSDDSSPRAGEASGPVLAELIATRAELKRVEGELQKFTEERQDLADKVARRQADFENYRKRMERERQETYGRVVAEVVGHLLPVVDNLRRAVDAEANIQASESEEFRHFLRGVELIARQLNGVLETLGVETVQTVGQPFDPHIHEAVAAEASDSFEPDTVMEELVRGYRLGDKLLRPAMVKVAK
ncbi:MAG TPA: nucleotide exchange factor GrpE, partial [Pyrinomonadaceae bacterium]